MMSKMDYEMLSKYIVSFFACDHRVCFEVVLDAFCGELKKDNPNFNVNLFKHFVNMKMLDYLGKRRD